LKHETSPRVRRCHPATEAAAPQRLSDFQRVVVADDANAVQRDAAEELVNYFGRISGQKLTLPRPGTPFMPVGLGLQRH